MGARPRRAIVAIAVHARARGTDDGERDHSRAFVRVRGVRDGRRRRADDDGAVFRRRNALWRVLGRGAKSPHRVSWSRPRRGQSRHGDGRGRVRLGRRRGRDERSHGRGREQRIRFIRAPRGTSRGGSRDRGGSAKSGRDRTHEVGSVQSVGTHRPVPRDAHDAPPPSPRSARVRARLRAHRARGTVGRGARSLFSRSRGRARGSSAKGSERSRTARRT